VVLLNVPRPKESGVDNEADNGLFGETVPGKLLPETLPKLVSKIPASGGEKSLLGFAYA
jgi:hypothetical protein